MQSTDLPAATTTRLTLRPFLWGALAVALAITAQLILERGFARDALLLYGSALVLFVALFRRWRLAVGDRDQRPTLPVDQNETARSAPVARPWLICLGGALLLLALALNGWSLRLFHDGMNSAAGVPTMAAWRFHVSGLLLMLPAVYLLDLGRRRSLGRLLPAPLPDAYEVAARRTLWVLLALLLVGILLRLYRFDSLPFGTWYDEAENGLQALRVLENPDFRPVYANSTHAPAHYIYLIAAAFQWLGVSTQSIRMVSVLFGLGTILAGYLAGREIFGRMGGLVLAALLAVSRWDVNLSRIGMYNITTPFFALLALGLLLRGIRRDRLLDFALAGLALGLGLCFYAAFQLFAAAVALFVLGLVVSQRGFLRRYWLHLVIMGVTAAAVIAPVVQFAYEQPEVYFDRTQQTSILARTAPEERLPALLESVRKHLLMFHVQGDPNGRHNLPGEPMLDPVSGALMVLGLAICLWRWRRPIWLFLPLGLGITMLGGILSLGFEAPQSLRAVGTLPMVYLLATAPVQALWVAWRTGDGRYFPALFALPLLLILAPAAAFNVQTYFGRQAHDFASWNAFSTPETLAANLLNQLPPQTNAHVISFFHGHPTLNFLAPDAPPYHRLETTDHFPLPIPADRDVAFIMDGESRALFEEIQRLYPNADLRELGPPFPGPKVLYYAHLRPADLAAVQGLMAAYYDNAESAGEPILRRREANLDRIWADDAPLSPPFSAEWSGVLRVDEYGLYQFALESSGPARLFIGEEEILRAPGQTEAGLLLAEGNHNIRVRTAVTATTGTDVGGLQLRWRPPDGEAEVTPAHAFYLPPVTSNGLLGRYFPNGDWQGPEALARIDPVLDLYFHIIPLPRPYTVEWTGKIAIPQSGEYRFGLESIDESMLEINGAEVAASLENNQFAQGAVTLEAGLHDIRVRFADRTDHTHIYLYWTPPWGGREIIPAAALFPPQEDYDQIELPSLADLNRTQPAGDAPPLPQDVFLPVGIETILDGLNAPRGVAVGPDGRIYVADTGAARVHILSADGELERTLAGREADGDDPFAEPFDVAVDSAGVLHVLDATQARVSRFDAQGRYLSDVAAAPSLFDRARGIFVDGNGVLWSAATPSGRIFAVAPDGAVLLDLPGWAGQPAQPVDVAVGADGAILATDAGLHKLIRYDAGGRRLLSWDIPVANTLDGAHLAVDGSGNFYMTEPEENQIVQLGPDGQRVGVWKLFLGPDRFVKPVGIDVGPDGVIWVVDVEGGALLRVTPDAG